MPLFYRYRGSVRRQWKLRILIDKFDPLEIPLLPLGIPFLIDPLDDRPGTSRFRRDTATGFHSLPCYPPNETQILKHLHHF